MNKATENLTLPSLVRVYNFCRLFHGAGLDAPWRIEEQADAWVCYGGYHVMSDLGYYTGWIYVTLYFDKWESMENACIDTTETEENADEGTVDGLIEYLQEGIEFVVGQMLSYEEHIWSQYKYNEPENVEDLPDVGHPYIASIKEYKVGEPEFESTEHALEWLFRPNSRNDNHTVAPDFCGSDVNGGNPCWTVSLNPVLFLNQHLEYADEDDVVMSEFCNGKPSMNPISTSTDPFSGNNNIRRWLTAHHPEAVGGFCAEGPEMYTSGNSGDCYSGSLISYDFDYWFFCDDFAAYVIIETHGHAVLFRENGCTENGWTNYCDACVTCTKCDFFTETQGGEWRGKSHPKHIPENIQVVDIEDNLDDPEREEKLKHYRDTDMLSTWDGEFLTCPCAGCHGVLFAEAL